MKNHNPSPTKAPAFFLLPLISASLFLVAACNKTPDSSTDAAPPASSPVAAPVSSGQPLILGAPTPEFGSYLTQRVSVTTPDGIVGYPGGTAVKWLSRDGDGIHVQTRDGSLLTVQPSQITEDVGAASAYSKSDLDAQRRADADSKARLATSLALQTQQAIQSAKDHPVQPSPTAVPWGTSLNLGGHDVEKQVAKQKKATGN